MSTSNHIPKEALAHNQVDLPSTYNPVEPPALVDPVEQVPSNEPRNSSTSNLKSTSTSHLVNTGFYPACSSLSTLCTGFDPHDDYAYELLAIFRRDMAPYCPFVLIPPDVSPRQLLTDRPFLWKAVVTAASHRSPTFQDAFGGHSFENFITELLLRGQPSSLDKLQAALVHLGWYVPHES